MKKRYLPFGYVICGGEMRADAEQAKIVCGIFEAYIAGNTLQEIAEAMTAQQIPYRPASIPYSSQMKSFRKPSRFAFPRRQTTPMCLRLFVKICGAGIVVRSCIGTGNVNNGFAANAGCGAYR